MESLLKLFKNSSDLVFQFSVEGKVVSNENLAAEKFFQDIPPDDLEKLKESLVNTIEKTVSLSILNRTWKFYLEKSEEGIFWVRGEATSLESQILHFTHIGVLVFDLNKGFIEINCRGSELLGVPDGSMNINVFKKFIDFRDIKKVDSFINEFSKNRGRRFEVLYRWKHPDGESRFIRMFGAKVEDTNRFYASIMDQTRQIKSEVRLRKTSLDIKNFVQTMPVGVCYLANDLSITSHSKSWADFFTGGYENLEGKNLNDLAPHFSNEFYKRIELAFLGRSSRLEENFKLDPQRKEQRVVWKFRPWAGMDGMPGVSVKVDDITLEYNLRMELELEKLKSIQTAKMALVGEVSASIAHEINNPLTIINGYLQQLELYIESDENYEEKIKSALEKAQNTVMRVSKIVNGLKNFSRDGKLDDPNLTNFNSLYDTTLTLCNYKVKKADAKLIVEGDTDVEFICQEVQLSQVLVNLISNSCDEIKGQDEPWIKVIVSDLNEYIGIRVVDSGKGIPPEIVKKLFTPYFTSKAKGKGTGLGMCISKNIAEAHHGSLNYEPFEGHTSFYLKVPKDPTDEKYFSTAKSSRNLKAS